MAARGTAVVPTLVNVENFPGFAAAGEKKFPAYASTMRRLYASSGAVVRAAFEAGVPVFAGTDAGGGIAHGVIADEVRALHAAGLPAEAALAAASWAARSWLGLPCIEEGAPADLVVYDSDPRADLDALQRPQRLLLRGRRRRLTRGGPRSRTTLVPAADVSIRSLPPELSAVRRAMSRPRPVEPAPLRPALDRGGAACPGPHRTPSPRRRRRPAGRTATPNAVPSGVCAKTLPSRASTAAASTSVSASIPSRLIGGASTLNQPCPFQFMTPPPPTAQISVAERATMSITSPMSGAPTWLQAIPS